MNGTWDLTKLYKDFSDPAFDADMEMLKKLSAEFTEYAGGLTVGKDDGEKLVRGITLIEDITKTLYKLAEYASLTQSADAKNTTASSKLGSIMAISSRTAAPMASFKKFVADIPADELESIKKSEPLAAEYSFMLDTVRADSAHLLDAGSEEIMARMSLSGSNAWEDLQGYLTSTVPVEYDGRTINLSTVRNLAYDPSPEVRKNAYEAELACYDRIKDAVAFALNSIKLETITESELRGFSSPLDNTLNNSRMKKETLDAMMSAMEEYMPVFRDYLKAKGRALGHENGLPWYDLFAPMGKSGKTYTVEEAKEYLLDIFGGFDTELHDMVKRAFEENWIDFFPRDGKRGGAFCSGVEAIGESRILTNFDGSFSDIVTLAHELGHAFHNLCLRDQRILNKDYSMPVAETASTFNECVVMNAAISNAEKEIASGNKDAKGELVALIESQLSDATQIICDIYSRFTFEKAVFDNRAEKFMGADELCEIMLDAQRKSYGDGLDPDCLHPYMWVCKSHYYGPIYYNFPYAFGGLFARGLYAQYKAEGAAFLPKYKKLLHDTSVKTVEDTALIAGIDLTDKKFWESGLESIAEEIREYIALLG